MFTRCTASPGTPTRSSTGSTRRRAARARAACAGGRTVRRGLDGATVDDPVLPAVLHTIEVFGLDRADFEAFLRSMEMDLTVTEYATYDDLLEYMAGSAAAIGTMMLPILGAARPRRRQGAGAPARAWRSSSPTSSATSAKTSTGGGSTCR